MSSFGDLEIFAKVVAAGSMSAAGRELGLSPAVVSKRLRRLEDRLGTRLMQRTTRQIALTESGQGFYERVIAILASVEEAETFVSGRQARAEGTLKITAPRAFGRMHIAKHLGDFLDRHEGLSVNLVLDDEMVDIVGEGYDLAIRIAELPDSSLVARRLADAWQMLVAAPAYLDRHGRPESVDDLPDHLCVPSDMRDPWVLRGPEGDYTHRPGGPLQTNSSEVVLAAIEGGLGIALRAAWEVGEAVREGRLERVLPDLRGAENTGIHALYPSRRYLPTKVRVLVDYLSELYGPTAYWEPAPGQTRPAPRHVPHPLARAPAPSAPAHAMADRVDG